MSSYYSRVTGTLQPGRTARSEDINSIQTQIEKSIEEIIKDMFGMAFILGESENAFKLYGTNIHTDQVNTDYQIDGYHWLSFYDVYLKQPIDIKKSSIETVRVWMTNDSNITTTVYAEIRDADFNLLQESNATLAPTPLDKEVPAIDFHFNLNHLPLGRYYLVIRPVDISATDLTRNGDENPQFDTITREYFCVRYDGNGSYLNGLEASLDGSNYLKATELPELQIPYDSVDYDENNADLCFEEIYSSGRTYTIEGGASAVVLGKKVELIDTHVTIPPAPDEGSRTDLVILTTDGELEVIRGTTYTNKDNKEYPVDNTGLNIAYITSFEASLNKVSVIEQNDENNITRHRDVLERLRRLEKKVNYQAINSSPTRIKYNCTIDPILSHNGLSNEEYARLDSEGTINMGTERNIDGDVIATTNANIQLAWSIIQDNYTYNLKTETTENGEFKIWDVTTTSSAPQSGYNNNVKGLYKYHIEVNDYSESKTPEPIGGLKLQVQVKKGGQLKKSYFITTKSNGQADLTFFSLKLAPGTYSVYTIYEDKKIKSKLKVVADNTNNITHKENYHTVTLSLPKASGETLTHTLPEGVIGGNDSFYMDNVEVDTLNGEVRVKKISNITDPYEVNDGRKLLKDTKEYDSKEISYTFKNNKNLSELPCLHVTFDREVFIKSITPYIAGFRNIDSIALLLFKNDVIYQSAQTHRNVYKKKVTSDKVKDNSYDDETFPTLYKSEYISLKDLQKSGKYQIPKTQVQFNNINLDLEPGSYTIVVCPKLMENQKEGEIKIKEYETKHDTNIYGTGATCKANKNISTLYISTSSLTDRSWDIAIEHKTYRYYDTGVLISKPIDTKIGIEACKVYKNFVVPNNCSIRLYISNDGGQSWQTANKDHTKFKTAGSSFRWKMEMKTNNISTPKLKFNQTKQYAINFNLATTATYMPYEDYQRCYETPLINANQITRNITRSNTTKTFSRWEFARVFMDDEELNSKIDILISYADDDYTTSVNSTKDKWNKIFFSTIFAGLTLDDFSHESIDYDNYEGNVEYDEYNYRFSLDSEDIEFYNKRVALASADAYADNPNIGYVYGDINEHENECFEYSYISTAKSPYVYKDNDGDSTKRNAGMHTINGPYWKAAYIGGECNDNDCIIGVRFDNGLDIDENKAAITIGLMPHVHTGTSETISGIDQEGNETSGTEVNYFPSGTFKVVLSSGQYGEYEEGIAQETVINKKLYSDTYTEVSVSILNNIEAFSNNGLNSIAIKFNEDARMNNPTSDNQENQDKDSIGIGVISTGFYSIRPYAPFLYTGSWDRFKWKSLKDSEQCRAFIMYSLINKNQNDSNGGKAFYPLDNELDEQSIREIKNDSVNLGANAPIINANGLQFWSSEGTSRRKIPNKFSTWNNYTSIKRNENQITTKFRLDGENTTKTYLNNDTGNQVLLHMPKALLGNMFCINVDIPYTLYETICIEYYVFTEYWKENEYSPDRADENSNINIHTTELGQTNMYQTYGSFMKGELYIDFYDEPDGPNGKGKKIESFALPSWGRVATQSEISNKVMHAWFKKRTSHEQIKSIVIRRANPLGLDRLTEIQPISLMLNDILFYSTEMKAALGPQMQMRIYPNNVDNLTNTKIRKTGGVYRL